MSDSLVLVWRQLKPHVTWHIRGIRNDGSYYGDITLWDESRQKDVDGRISAEDNRALQALAARIQQGQPTIDDGNEPRDFGGALFHGPYSSPKLIMQYRIGDEAFSQTAKDFLALVAIMCPYI